MTIAEALKKYKVVEADLLLGHVLKQSKEFLYLHPKKKLTSPQKKLMQTLVKQRGAGIPAAYLLGYKYFYGLKFTVNRNVLIPRPETEWLVERTLRIIAAKLKRKGTNSLEILDLGTGSGCIAISIMKNTPSKRIKVTASDKFAKALTVAKANAKTYKTKLKFIESDLFQKIPKKFDLIIANLPYVPLSDYKKLYKNLKYEPKSALTDGGNKFTLLKKFLKQAPEHLNDRGVVLLEVDPKFFKTNKKQSWRIVKDLHNLNRFALMKGPTKKPLH